MHLPLGHNETRIFSPSLISHVKLLMLQVQCESCWTDERVKGLERVKYLEQLKEDK
jgi:hypothetical protein